MQKTASKDTRRSGVMDDVRLGLPIQELALLGRWKSSVVLTYAEDALQSEPATTTTRVYNESLAPASSTRMVLREGDKEGGIDHTTHEKEYPSRLGRHYAIGLSAEFFSKVALQTLYSLSIKGSARNAFKRFAAMPMRAK